MKTVLGIYGHDKTNTISNLQCDILSPEESYLEKLQLAVETYFNGTYTFVSLAHNSNVVSLYYRCKLHSFWNYKLLSMHHEKGALR